MSFPAAVARELDRIIYSVLAWTLVTFFGLITLGLLPDKMVFAVVVGELIGGSFAGLFYLRSMVRKHMRERVTHKTKPTCSKASSSDSSSSA